MKHLRYGNLVDTPYGIGAVMAYNKNSIHVEIDGQEKLVMMSEVKDIPITEEWLGKIANSRLYVNGELLCTISTISQLQNIYFDIEGVELW